MNIPILIFFALLIFDWFFVNKLNILKSKQSLIHIFLWILFSIVYWATIKNQLFMWFGIAVIFTYTVLYFKEKNKEQSILNTISHLINDKNTTSISIDKVAEPLHHIRYGNRPELDQVHLNYMEKHKDDLSLVKYTLIRYKEKGIIPYNITIVD
jgi:hypothetical protein